MTREEKALMKSLRQFDGRRAASSYPADELERLIIRDAVMGFEYQPNGMAFLWWATQGYEHLTRLRGVDAETVFTDIAARISVETGRVWP